MYVAQCVSTDSSRWAFNPKGAKMDDSTEKLRKQRDELLDFLKNEVLSSVDAGAAICQHYGDSAWIAFVFTGNKARAIIAAVEKNK